MPNLVPREHFGNAVAWSSLGWQIAGIGGPAVGGLVLGWFGLADLAVGLYAGFVLGAAMGVALMVVGRVRRGVTIPFGPFLAAGTMITILALGSWADWLRDLYA